MARLKCALPDQSREWRRDIIRYNKLWQVSVKLGVVGGVVEDLAASLYVTTSSWRPPEVTPAKLVDIVRGDDFAAGCRSVVLADAPWFTWAHHLHADRYIKRAAPRAFQRVYGSLRPDVLRVIGAVYEWDE